MKKHGMTLAQALQHVQSIRPVASPNAGFIKQLQDLEKSLQGNNAFSVFLNSYTHMHTYSVYDILGVFCSCHVCGGESKLEALLLCLSSAIVDEDLRVT